MTTDTPAPEAETGPASLSDLLDGRHQTTPDHETHREVGDRPMEPDAAPPSSDQAAPMPAPAPAPAATAPTAEPDPATDPKSPRWYREHMAKTNRELAQLRAAAAAPPSQPRPDAALSEEEMNRPLTRAELLQFHERQRLADKVERSEETFADKHGDDTLEEVRAWLMSKATPQGNAMEAWAMAQRNPWASAYQQYQREKVADEIGDDPAAYRARLEETIRAEYEARASATPQPAPAAPTMRAAPPQPASTARSAAPRDQQGRFAGPTPIRTRNDFR